MLSRRQFFRGILPSRGEATPAPRPHSAGDGNQRRRERYRSLETYAVVDLIPGNVALCPDQEFDLRRRLRQTLEIECDEDLFSMKAVGVVEGLTAGFLAEIGETEPESRS